MSDISFDQISPYATHVPVLAAMLAKTEGPVLELGVGHYSTPLIHTMCKDRMVMSIDSDCDWLKFFAERYSMCGHYFEHIGNPLSKVLPVFLAAQGANFGGELDVVFIDHAPGEDRVKCVEVLRNRAGYLIVHDSQGEAYGWGNIFETFKYRYDWNYGNRTTVVSDIDEIGL